MLKINKPIVCRVAVDVLKFNWCGQLVPGAIATTFRCSACGGKLGARWFGIAWIRDANGIERSLRLCEECGKSAEAGTQTPAGGEGT